MKEKLYSDIKFKLEELNKLLAKLQSMSANKEIEVEVDIYTITYAGRPVDQIKVKIVEEI